MAECVQAGKGPYHHTQESLEGSPKAAFTARSLPCWASLNGQLSHQECSQGPTQLPTTLQLGCVSLGEVLILSVLLVPWVKNVKEEEKC